jgi:endonuclease III
MRDATGWAAAVVERLGGHPAGDLGLDLEDAADRTRWLMAACLLAERVGEDAARDAWRRLAAQGLDAPERLAASGPVAVEAALAGGRLPRPEVTARKLVRVARTLAARHGGRIDALADEALDFPDLAGRVARLAPGVGAATVLRFLAPLRDRWAAARETPLAAAARAAAVCLGVLAEGQDEEGEPGALRAALRDAEAEGGPMPADVEAALERLGRRACQRRRSARCPLGERCPARTRPIPPSP